MTDIKTRLSTVRERIAQAEQQFQRAPGSVKLLAVSKTWPAEAILEAAQQGQQQFGENYLQEAVEKINTLSTHAKALKLEWHYIGAIQSNKTKEIAQHFDWVHSVDRLKIAQRLSDQRPAHLPDLNICLQVNISGEASKSGTTQENALDLAQAISTLPQIRLRGLMAIPAPATSLEQQHEIFQQVYQLQQQLMNAGLDVDTLSMGMSNDLEAAIAEGSTMVRIGRAIFGPRNTAKKPPRSIGPYL